MAGNGFLAADQYLTGGISKTIRYWSPDNDIQWSGTLWELNPVEVVSRTRAQPFLPPLPAPEAAIFTELGIDCGPARLSGGQQPGRWSSCAIPPRVMISIFSSPTCG